MRPHILVSIISLLLCISACKQPMQTNSNYISVKTYGAKGDGKTDDTQAIQNAFDASEYVYFPAGTYRIAAFSKTKHNPAALIISEAQKVRNIKFDDAAKLYLPAKLNWETESMVLLKIIAKKDGLPNIHIDNLSIEAQQRSDSDARTVMGLKAIEDQSTIQKLTINNGKITNMPGIALVTYATDNLITNLTSQNNRDGGIGALNPYNQGKVHQLVIENFTSLNDGGYGINFSGATDGQNRKLASDNDIWRGRATNVRCINSERGIKTAGRWDLELNDILIDGSEHYGLFINKDAPKRTINIDGLEIRNTKDAGISLSNKTNVNMRNVKILNCGKGLLTFQCPVRIDSLEIVGAKDANFGLRIANDTHISNFSISGFTEDYVAWITGGNVTLENGRFFNNNCTYPLLIHEKAAKVTLDNITFDTPTKRNNSANILSLQKQENLSLRRMPKGCVKKQ